MGNSPAPWLDPILDEAHEALCTRPDAEEARVYLASRGVTLAQLGRYRVGFGLSAPTITTCSASFVHFASHHWSGHLIFPLTTVLGDAIGVQTRPISKKDYQIYSAVPRDLYPLVFGLAQAIDAIWASRRVVLVEGAFDLFAVGDVAPDALAMLTARVPQATQRFLRRWADHVVALLDMDEAGRAGAARLLATKPPYFLSAPAYPAHDLADLRQLRPEFDLKRLLTFNV
jgi:hypothetical protein